MRPGDTFPERLRYLRERRRMNRAALGELVGMSKGIIGLYENGKIEPKLSALMELADFFEVSLDALCGREKFTKN